VYLAPDPDREGEAIAYHLKKQLEGSVKDKKKLLRVTFNEITPKAVKAAFAHARDVDDNLMYAQQTQRHRLHAACTQVRAYLVPQQRRDLVSHQRSSTRRVCCAYIRLSSTHRGHGQTLP